MGIYRALERSRATLGVIGTHANAASQPDVIRSPGLQVPDVFLHITLTAALEVHVLGPRQVTWIRTYDRKGHSTPRLQRKARSPRVQSGLRQTLSYLAVPSFTTLTNRSRSGYKTCHIMSRECRGPGPGLLSARIRPAYSLTRDAVAILGQRSRRGCVRPAGSESESRDNTCERRFPGGNLYHRVANHDGRSHSRAP